MDSRKKKKKRKSSLSQLSRTHVFRIKYPLPLKRSMQNSREALSRIDLLTLKLHWMNISTDFKRMNAFFSFINKNMRWRYQMPSRTKCQKLQQLRLILLVEQRTEHEINRVLVLHTHFSHVIIDKVKLFVKMHQEN